MNRYRWKTIGKYGSVLCILAALGLAAWVKIDTKSKAPAVAANVNGDNGNNGNNQQEQPMRTEEVFDKNKYKGLLTIRYFYLPGDVAQGDCILIQTPDGKNMLIDSGNTAVGSKVVEYLNKLGVDEIHIALNTHPHPDHIGGFSTIVAAKKVHKFYMENMPYSSNAYNGTMSALKRKNVPIEYLSEGSAFDLGELHFEVLSPSEGALADAVKSRKQEQQGDSEAAIYNYFSLVTKMTYKNNTFLFGGDIYKDREGELIQKYGSKLDVDFAHINHHGWTTSSDSNWIKTLSPQYAIASNNIFNSLDILRRYDMYKTKIFTTRNNGNTLITSDGNKLNAITEKDFTGTLLGILKNQ